MSGAGTAAKAKIDSHTVEVVAAYLRDRAHQWVPSSGIHGAVLDLAHDVLRGEAEDAFAHGELDDLLDRVRRIAGRKSR